MNDTKNMVFVAKVVDAHNPYAVTMAVLGDDIFIGTTPVFGAIDGGDFIRYRTSDHTFEFAFSVFEQGILFSTVLDGKMYVPGFDSQGSHDFGNLYIYDGLTVVRKESIPKAIHVYQVASAHGCLYVNGVQSKNGINDQALWRSHDDGDNWELFIESRSDPSGNTSKGQIFGYRDELFVVHYERDEFDPSVGTGIMGIFDGFSFRFEEPLDPAKLYKKSDWGYAVFGESLLFRMKRNIAERVGEGVWEPWKRLPSPLVGTSFDNMQEHGGRLFALSKERKISGSEQRTTYLSSTADGREWVIEGEYVAENLEFEHLESHNGRLWTLSSSPNLDIAPNPSSGSLFVSASAPRGSMKSKKYRLEHAIASGIVSWDALTPPGTRVRFQIRTARNRANLKNKA